MHQTRTSPFSTFTNFPNGETKQQKILHNPTKRGKEVDDTIKKRPRLYFLFPETWELKDIREHK